jgi:hypothetical protein
VFAVATQALLAAGIQTAGSIVLGTGAVAPAAAAAAALAAGSQQSELGDSEADARVLAALLQVSAVLCLVGR